MTQSKQVKHTAAPYKYSGESLNYGDNGISWKTFDINALSGEYIGCTERLPDAEFIVRACNSHEALVKACKEYQRWWNNVPEFDKQAGAPLSGTIIKLVDQALKQAE